MTQIVQLFFMPGVSSLDAGVSGKMGLRTIIYYFATTFAAIIVGIVLVLAIHPGNDMLKDELLVGTEGNRVTSLDAFLDLIRLVKQMETKLIHLMLSVLFDLWFDLPVNNYGHVEPII